MPKITHKKSEKFNASIMKKSKKETSMSILEIITVVLCTSTLVTVSVIALKNYFLEVNETTKKHS
jgi:hypothetical protein